MPIINWIWAIEGESTDIENLKKTAKRKMDEASNLKFLINQRPLSLELSKFRFQCVIPNISLPKDNILDIEPGSAVAVADGFWIYFQPLTKNLLIETFGTCQSGLIKIAAKYQLLATDD